MFIFLLVLYTLALSVGIGLLLLGLLSYEKLRLKALRDASFIAVGATLLLLVDAVRTSVTALHLEFDPALRLFCLILAVLGGGIQGYALPAIAYRVVEIPVNAVRWIFHAAAIALLVLAAYWKETSGSVLSYAVFLWGIGALHIYAASVVLVHFGRIQEQTVKYLLRALLILIAVQTLVMILETLITTFFALPQILRGIPAYQLLYQLSTSCVVIVFAFKYMFRPTLSADCALPLDFISQYGISDRECEIICLVIQGDNYKRIGDRLFISSRTVKNHIYNVYQKTGVANKVQLMNVIRSCDR